jgi:long-chain fatty acid transport protein
MSKRLVVCAFLFIGLLIPVDTLATNGDNLIGVGPISRAMGGVGIAAPQDAISAVFSNPAAMCFGAFCPSNQVDFAGTAFMPNIHASIATGAGPFPGISPVGVFSAHSDPKVFPIPALGISYSFPDLPRWRFGFGAYGVTGLGVDYRGTSIDQANFFNFGPGGTAPLASGAYSNLQIMKFAPTVAYQVNHWLSLGAAFNISYSTLDLRNGSNSGFAPGAQIGAIIKPHQDISIGLTYTSPQDVKHGNVLPGPNGSLNSLSLSSPNNLGVGVSWEAIPRKLLFETDFKWLNWSNADGYRNFDWKDQYVFGIGAQFKPIPKLALRLGYNYGNNPVKPHQNFVGATVTPFGPSPRMTSVQGTPIPVYYFETFRTIGFPAIIEHHITAGIGYDVTDRFVVNIGFMYAFDNTITATGTNMAAQPTTLKSKLSETGVDVGLSWRF